MSIIRMKKIILTIAVLIALSIVITSFVWLKSNPLLIKNIEALSDEEGTPSNLCYTVNYSSEEDATYFLKCNDKTSDSMLYPCLESVYGVKGISSHCIR